MSTLIELLYFVIIVPLAIVLALIYKKYIKNLDAKYNIIFIGILTFLVRILLVPFSGSIGQMPYIMPNLLFYTLLTIFGTIFTIGFVLFIENKSLKEIGWVFERKKLIKGTMWGLAAFLPMIAMFPLIIFLANLKLSTSITIEKLIIGIEFGIILGGFYEETIFRGILQDYFNEITSRNKSILYTALIFVATHIGYLPFTGFGIYYIFILVMAILLSLLRDKFDLFSCAIFHGGLVFILIIFI